MKQNISQDILTTDSHSTHERDKSLRLFRFLRELAQLRNKVVRSLDSYDKVLWLNDIPQERECECIAWYFHNQEKEPEYWLSVQQPSFMPIPNVPADLEKWIITQEIHNSKNERPQIKDKIVEQIEIVNEETNEVEYETNIINFEDNVELQHKWETYVNEKWIPWAKEDRRLNKIQDIYKDLFTIYQKQQKLSETYEVIIGLGLLSWKTPINQEVKRHILTAQASLEFDSKRGLITLNIAAEGAKPLLELDMLEADERPGIKEIMDINSLVEEMCDSIWSKNQVNPILASFVHSISNEGIYEDTLKPNLNCDSNPIIHLAPAVILRKRGERSLIQLFKEIEKQLSDDERKIPEGIIRLVSIYEQKNSNNENSEISGDNSEIYKDPDEIYFPLPTNKDQKEIVKKISCKNGVLVQGPPGTGKSHTIANLICHLLAQGKRVLVTSHTTRALEVLQSKIPNDISSLCVSLLGNDQASLKKLENSVEGINYHYCNWNESLNRNVIELQKQKLDEARKKEAELFNSLRAIREEETYKYNDKFVNYKGTLKDIAESLKLNEEKYSWIGNIDYNEENIKPLLSNQEAIIFLNLLRKYTPEKRTRLDKKIIASNDIPNIDKFIDFVNAEKHAIDKFNENKNYEAHGSYSLLKDINDELLDEIYDSLNVLFVSLDKIINHRQPYTNNLVEDILADHDRKWKLLFKITKEKISEIEKDALKYSETILSGLTHKDLLIIKYDAEDLLAYISNGKTINILSKAFNPVFKRTKYIYQEIRVNGALCDNIVSLKALINWIEIEQNFKYLYNNWNGIAEVSDGTFLQRLEEYKDIIEPLEEALKLYESVELAKMLLDDVKGLEHPIWHKPEQIKDLINIINVIKMKKTIDEHSEKFTELEKILLLEVINNDNDVINKLSIAIKNRDIENYKNCLDTIKDIENQRNEMTLLDEFIIKLNNKLPYLLELLLKDNNQNYWDTKFGSFEQAWEFAIVDSWLKKITDPVEQEKLTEALKSEQRKINNIMQILVESKAWRHCLSKMTEMQRHHLKAWAIEVKLIGKGTGKNAIRHRENARKNMNYCRDVIPAWIMPIYRVAETIHPGDEIFDVCIIDEASQSGPEALFLYYLAKKIIVVGDDKQISPKFIGIKEEDVDYLRKQYLNDIPLSETFGINQSFFDQSAIRFGDTIRLVEHFRCMPEIIQFSNNLCYSSEPLIPVRQFGADRLAPVNTVYIKNGYMQKSGSNKVNNPEAEALVDKIADCCQDPAYEDKTKGVISLLGEAQAKLIETLLLEKIGAEEINARKIICGDAYEFQGDERDVIFLSMVSAPSEEARIGVLAKEEDKKRFNVAVSRAKDQLWLFHSATLNDLSNKCLRYNLLSYCQSPKVELTEYNNEVRPDIRHEDFDSLFEQRVFLKITEKGYRVVPQYKIAGYSIDLMIFGMDGRLAVECDGDEYHTAANYEEDMSRQRDLERYGLKFWRIRGSEFYRNPDKSLESLWLTLEKLGIKPGYIECNETIIHNLNEEEINNAEGIEIETHQEDKDEDDYNDSNGQGVTQWFSNANFKNPFVAENIVDKSRISMNDLMVLIVDILEGCPNNSCKKSSLTQRVCSYLGIRTRCKPREALTKKIMRATNQLINQNVIEEYKSVNTRIRLLKPRSYSAIKE